MRDAPTRICENPAFTVAGQRQESGLDCLIFGTGFEVGTAHTRRAGYDITGKEGLALSQQWQSGPQHPVLSRSCRIGRGRGRWRGGVVQRASQAQSAIVSCLVREVAATGGSAFGSSESVEDSAPVDGLIAVPATSSSGRAWLLLPVIQLSTPSDPGLSPKGSVTEPPRPPRRRSPPARPPAQSPHPPGCRETGVGGLPAGRWGRCPPALPAP